LKGFGSSYPRQPLTNLKPFKLSTGARSSGNSGSGSHVLHANLSNLGAIGANAELDGKAIQPRNRPVSQRLHRPIG
jgi:hypothetical protein